VVNMMKVKPVKPPRPAKKPLPEKISRKVYFYDVNPGIDSNGAPAIFDVAAVLNHVAGLAWDATGRYLEAEDGNAVACWPFATRNRIVIGTIRRSGLPQVETSGKLAPIPIDPNDGLVERTHAVFFPAEGILACEFNFHGPRASRLAKYLKDKVPFCPRGLSFDLKLNHDASEKLAALEDIRLLDLRARASFADELADVDESLAAAFAAAGRVGKTIDVELILRPKRGKGLGANIVRALKKLVSKKSLHEQAKALKVRGKSGDSGRVEEVDLLSDALVVTKEIKRIGSSRAVDSAAAFRALEDAQHELPQLLPKSATLLLGDGQDGRQLVPVR
jgi:hypothetical protein